MKLIIIFYSILLLSFQIAQNDLKIGRYNTKHKNESYEILIRADSTFVYRKGRWSYTYGQWKIAENKLILNSKLLTQMDSINIAISSGSYFKIENEIMLIKKDKLINNKSLKFKYREN